MIPILWMAGEPRRPGPRRQPEMQPRFGYLFRWGVVPDRKGEACRVLARGSRNSVVLEFADGFKMVASGNSICQALESETR